MKRNFVLVTLCTMALLSATSVFAQKKDKKGESMLSTTQDSISYIIGQDIGGNFKKNAIDVNVDAFLKGLTEALKGNDSLITEARKIAIMSKFQQELQTTSKHDQRSRDQQSRRKSISRRKP